MIQKLIDEFHNRLDEALILALSSEYDLSDAESLQSLRDILLDLAHDAEAEEASGFNPDGLGMSQNNSTTDNQTDPKSSSYGTSQARDSDGALGSLDSSGTSYADEESTGDSVVPRIFSFDGASKETKNRQLALMFPSLEQSEVDAALDLVGGGFQDALDHLLTLQFVQSTEVRSKAIDAFFKPENEPGGKAAVKKGKKKRKKGPDQTSGSAQYREAESETTSVNNILFISERLDIPFDAVAAAYQQNGCSRGKATAAVLDSFISQGVEAQGDAATARVKELRRQYKKVPERYLSAVVQIADTIPRWTDDIASLLEKHFAEASRGPLRMSYSLTPIEDEIEDGFVVVTGKKNNGTSGKGTVGQVAAPPSYSGAALSGLSSATLRGRASAFEQARASDRASAARAARKGNSNPLYKQVAAVYADRARENAQSANAMNSRAAYRLVAEGRTESCIDLHGVSVSDGVGIAQGAVRAWYDGLGEFRARDAKRGFTVITGLGKHSPGGVSRMRQAVCAALVNGGWKVEVGTGKFIVTGRR